MNSKGNFFTLNLKSKLEFNDLKYSITFIYLFERLNNKIIKNMEEEKSNNMKYSSHCNAECNNFEDKEINQTGLIVSP